MWVQYWPEDLLAQWSIEAVTDAKTRYHWILSKYDHVFWWEQLVLQGSGVKSLRFVNQSNVHKPDFKIDQIALKHFRKLFHKKQIFWLKLADQLYLRIRLKSCYCFQLYSRCPVEINFSPLLCVGFFKDYIMQSYQALKYLLVLINKTWWVSKVGCYQKIAQTGK